RRPRDRAPVQPRDLPGMVEARADGGQRMGRGRRADRSARPVLPWRAAARAGCECSHARCRLRRRAREPHLPRLRRGADDLSRAQPQVARRRHRRHGAGARGAREFRGADRRVAQGPRRELRAGERDEGGRGMSGTVRLTAAQALVRYLAALSADTGSGIHPLFGGVSAIFGHGNVAGIGEALYAHRDTLPTFRAHNEQAMAHAAIAYAKASMRRRMMACTTSIGPGATNMVTAAALAHVNRLPVLLVPGDVFASRAPDPVLQQVEDFGDATVSANDCFRPVSRYFDRITRPEQLIDSLPKALATMLDPASCGPATLAFCQDVQAEAFDYPEHFFARRLWRQRRQPADAREMDALV